VTGNHLAEHTEDAGHHLHRISDPRGNRLDRPLALVLDRLGIKPHAEQADRRLLPLNGTGLRDDGQGQGFGAAHNVHAQRHARLRGNRLAQILEPFNRLSVDGGDAVTRQQLRQFGCAARLTLADGGQRPRRADDPGQKCDQKGGENEVGKRPAGDDGRTLP